jgi:hypothetical protein
LSVILVIKSQFVEKYHHTALLIKKAGGQIEATAPPPPSHAFNIVKKIHT